MQRTTQNVPVLEPCVHRRLCFSSGTCFGFVTKTHCYWTRTATQRGINHLRRKTRHPPACQEKKDSFPPPWIGQLTCADKCSPATSGTVHKRPNGQLYTKPSRLFSQHESLPLCRMRALTAKSTLLETRENVLSAWQGSHVKFEEVGCDPVSCI